MKEKKIQNCDLNRVNIFVVSFELPGQHFGTIARKVAGSGAHSKQCGSIISNPNVDGHSIFSQ